MNQRGALYLVGDATSKVLDGELRDRHLWLQIQWVVTMVIVTLLEKSVVCRLATNEINNNLIKRVTYVSSVCSGLGFCFPHLREIALVIQNPQYPMRLSGDKVDAGLVVVE